MVLNLRRLSGKSSRSSTGSQDLTNFISPPPKEIPSPLEICSPLSPDDSVSERESPRRSLRKSSGSQSQALLPSPSKDSLVTETGESLWTESSGSTIPGPGAITGRVIKAIGNIAVVGIDNVIIKRRMATYRTLFPHGRYVDQTEDDGWEMYSEILEFTRPGFYPPSIRKDALDLLMIQINIRETHQLMRALDEYFDHEDFRAFLYQLLDLDTEASQRASVNTFASEEAKFSASIPLAIFIFRLSFSQRRSHRIAVNSFLLGMCSMKSLLGDHLLRIFKFGQDSDYLDSLEDCPPEERQTLWKVLAYLRPGELLYLEERLRSRLARIDEILKQGPVKVDLRSVCYDLIEFSRNGLEHLMENIRVWAYSRIFTFLARGGIFWEALISTLAKVPHGDQYRIMSRILYCTLPALNLSPGTLDLELVGAYHDAMQSVFSPYDESRIFDLFFRFVIQAFSTQGSLRAALMLDQHFLSIIILCLAPPPPPSTSDEMLRLITQTYATR
ncbi:hypothetical protein C0995_016616 [Termitomyces sp. Mi166|nr:hypothetical protein C0995_016616 [Termitomyces sp. Mi166\